MQRVDGCLQPEGSRRLKRHVLVCQCLNVRRRLLIAAQVLACRLALRHFEHVEREKEVDARDDFG